MEPKQYITMAELYDRWMDRDNAPYEAWGAYIHSCFERYGRHVSRVVDAGCGTGNLLARLQDLGYSVDGFDPSEHMLARAREKALPSARLQIGKLPTEAPEGPSDYDGAICSFDVLNYLGSDSELGEALRYFSRVLRRGGVLVFDLNTRYKLETVYANYHAGDDFEDFAYVWRNRLDAEAQRCTFHLSFFVQRGPGYERLTETHQQRWYAHEVVQQAADDAGFVVREITDAYGSGPLGTETRRETWVLTRS